MHDEIHTDRHDVRLGSATVIVRPEEISDIPEVLRLWARSRSKHATTPDREEDLHRLVVRDHGALLVAEDNQGLIGALIAAWDGWRGNMYRLAIVPERRRDGIARRLVESGEQRLRSLGARRVTALVARTTHPPGSSGTPLDTRWTARSAVGYAASEEMISSLCIRHTAEAHRRDGCSRSVSVNRQSFASNIGLWPTLDSGGPLSRR